MTFEEWAAERFMGGMELQFAKAAWRDATITEREACAKRWETSHGFDKHGVAEWLRSND